MALLRILVPYQWRVFWRGLRARGAWGGTNLSLVVVLALWLLPGHITSSVLAAFRMHEEPTGAGPLLAEMNLTGLLVAWLLIPLVITGLQAHGEGVTPWRLAQFPLRPRQLMLAGISGSLVHPGYWLLALASLAGLLPIALAPHPATGLVAGAIFFASAAMLSWALGLFGSVLFSSRRAREWALAAITLVATSFVFLADARPEHRPEGFFVTAWGREWLLSDTSGEHGVLPAVRDNTPGSWVVGAAVGRSMPACFALLLAWFALSWNLAVWSLRRTISRPVSGLGGGRRMLATISPFPFLPVPLGLATRKELRYLLRTMDTLLGLALGLGSAVYLAIALDPSRMVIFFGVPVILMMEMAMPMNSFGLDRSGADRYRLLPLSGREVVLSKNVAYFLVVLLQVAPIVIVSAVRFGAPTALATLLGTASLGLLMATWGNVMSVKAPSPRAFYNFDSTEQAGGVGSILYSVFIWLIPGLTAAFTGSHGELQVVLGQVAVFLASALLYRRLVTRAGALFDAGAELMRARLAG